MRELYNDFYIGDIIEDLEEHIQNVDPFFYRDRASLEPEIKKARRLITELETQQHYPCNYEYPYDEYKEGDKYKYVVDLPGPEEDAFLDIDHELVQEYSRLDVFFTAYLKTHIPATNIKEKNKDSLEEAKKALKILDDLVRDSGPDAKDREKILELRRKCEAPITQLQDYLEEKMAVPQQPIEEETKEKSPPELTLKSKSPIQRLELDPTPTQTPTDSSSDSKKTPTSIPSPAPLTEQKLKAEPDAGDLESIYDFIREAKLCKEAAFGFIKNCDAMDQFLASRGGNPILDPCWRDWVDLILIFQDQSFDIETRLSYLNRSITYFSHIAPQPSYVTLLIKLRQTYSIFVDSSPIFKADLAWRRECYAKQYKVAKEFTKVSGIQSTDSKKIEKDLVAHCSAPLTSYKAAYQGYHQWRRDSILPPIRLIPPYLSQQDKGGLINNLTRGNNPSSSYKYRSFEKWHRYKSFDKWHRILERVSSKTGNSPQLQDSKRVELPAPSSPPISAPTPPVNPSRVTTANKPSLEPFYQVQRYFVRRATQSPIQYFKGAYVLRFSQRDYIERRKSWGDLLACMDAAFSLNPPGIDYIIKKIDMAIYNFSNFGHSNHYAQALSNLRTGLETGQIKIDETLKTYLKQQNNLVQLEVKVINAFTALEEAEDEYYDTEEEKNRLLISLNNYHEAYQRYLSIGGTQPFEPLCPADAIYNPQTNTGLLASILPPDRAKVLAQDFLDYREGLERQKRKQNATTESKAAPSTGKPTIVKLPQPPKDKPKPADNPERKQGNSALSTVIKLIDEKKQYLQDKPPTGRLCHFFPNKDRDHDDTKVLDDLHFHLTSYTLEQAPEEQQLGFLNSPFLQNKLAELRDLQVKNQLSESILRVKTEHNHFTLHSK